MNAVGAQPVRVEFTFDTPMIPPDNGLLHLDGLLAWAVTMRRLREPADSRLEQTLGELANDLPLAKYEAAAGRWVWCASALRIETYPLARQATFVRRTDFDDLAMLGAAGQVQLGRAKKFTADGGPLRNYLFRYPVVQVKRATAYAIGDFRLIEDLLQDVRVTGIGMKTTYGFGGLKDVVVVPIEGEPCHWKWRTMPEPGMSLVEAQGCLRPPYWDRTQYERVWVPIDAAGVFSRDICGEHTKLQDEYSANNRTGPLK